MARPESDTTLAVAEKPAPPLKAAVEEIRRGRALRLKRRRLVSHVLIRSLQVVAAVVCGTEVVLALLERQHPHAPEMTGVAFASAVVLEWIRFSSDRTGRP
jgi:hypothetical protein